MSRRGTPDSEDADSAVRRYWETAIDWFLLTGHRSRIAALLVATFAVLLVAFLNTLLVPLANTQALFYIYSGLVTGNITLITVVVSINQLLLGRELQTPGELRSQLDNVVDYRSNVESAAGRVPPVKPLGFLRLLVESTRQEAQRLGGFARDGTVREAADDIDDVVTQLTEQLDHVDALLVESETDTFSVLSTMLTTNYAEQINQLRTIQHDHGDALPNEINDCVDDLIDRLQDIDIARQYFKSIYLEQELSTLSRMLLLVGLPAVAVAVAGLLTLTVSSSNPSAAVDLILLLTVTLSLGVVPLAILASFILRTATVTRLTAATLPFTTPEQER